MTLAQLVPLNLAQLVMFKDPKLGPVNNVTAYIYIHIYIYAVGLITWPFFGQSRVNNLAMVELITWPSFFEPIKIGFFGDFWCTIIRGWCKISVFEKKIGQKRGFRKKNVHLFFWEFWLYFLVAA